MALESSWISVSHGSCSVGRAKEEWDMSRAKFKLAALLLALLVTLPAMSGEGRIPVWGPPGVPIPIAADGQYIVTRNISGPGGGLPAIDISAAKVDLDLNGFTIDNAAGDPVIAITGVAPDNIRIHNGTLAKGGTHVLRVGGVSVVRKVAVEEVKSEDAGGSAVALAEVEQVVIRNNIIIDPGGGGIFLPSPPFTTGEVTHNTIKRTGGDGIFVTEAAGMEISHNHLEVPGVGGGGSGIVIVDSVGNLVGENQISDAGIEGIHLRNSKGNKIYNNVIRHAFVNGIVIDVSSGDNLVLNNVATDCGFMTPPGHGLAVAGKLNKILGNILNSNEACGLYFIGTSSDNTFGRNTARGNDPGGAGDCAPATAFCTGILFPPNSCDAAGAAAANDTSLNNMIPALF